VSTTTTTLATTTMTSRVLFTYLILLYMPVYCHPERAAVIPSHQYSWCCVL
jgi:hypothetical protein